jgi:hypothetical protein
MSKVKETYWGTGLFDTPFVIKRWIFTWRFPFICKVIVWEGTPLEAQKEINRIRNDELNLLIKEREEVKTE